MYQAAHYQHYQAIIKHAVRVANLDIALPWKILSTAIFGYPAAQQFHEKVSLAEAYEHRLTQFVCRKLLAYKSHVTIVWQNMFSFVFVKDLREARNPHLNHHTAFS